MINKIVMSTGLRWLWLTLVILALDLSSKKVITMYFQLGDSISIIPFVNFIYANNAGAAFSFLSDSEGWQRWILSAIAIIIAVILIVMMYRLDMRDRLPNVSYSMIIGGALGNLFDRIVHGVVIGFIDIYIGNWHWPTFNIADASICIGAILITLEGFFYPARKIVK